MSCYIYFFVRKNDTFVLLDSFSRNSIVFQEFESAPWEKVSKLNLNLIEQAQNSFCGEIKELKNEIKKNKGVIKDILKAGIGQAGNEEYVYGLQKDIDEYKANIALYKRAVYFMSFVKNIAEFDGNEIYYGMECYDPTLEDVE